jgi:hypothetical protein
MFGHKLQMPMSHIKQTNNRYVHILIFCHEPQTWNPAAPVKIQNRSSTRPSSKFKCTEYSLSIAYRDLPSTIYVLSTVLQLSLIPAATARGLSSSTLPATPSEFVLTPFSPPFVPLVERQKRAEEETVLDRTGIDPTDLNVGVVVVFIL